jgi:hypothetical protein
MWWKEKWNCYPISNVFEKCRSQWWQCCTLTPKTESMFHSISFHTTYFENEWANSKWVNTRVVVSKVHYNCKNNWSKKQLRFGSKWISKLTTRIDSVAWPVFGITKFFGNASFLKQKMTSIFYSMLLYTILKPTPIGIVKIWHTNALKKIKM